MTARTHDIIAFASLVTLSAYFPPSTLTIATTFTCLVGCVIGALIPDLDQATNRLWDLLPAGNLLGRVFRKLLLQHRTLSHSLVGIYIFYLLLSFVTPRLLNPNYVDVKTVVFSLMIGLISHIIADMTTKDGVPLLFPIPIHIGFPPIKSLRVTTGKLFENIIIFPGVVVYILWFVYTKRDLLLHLVKLIRS